MKHLRKRSLSIAGHRTSIALEPEFWAALEEIGQAQGLSLSQFVAEADASRMEGTGLASHLRLVALNHYRNKGGDV